MLEVRTWLVRGAIVAGGVGVSAGVAFGLPWDIDMADSQAVKAFEQPMRPLPEGSVPQPNTLAPKGYATNFAPMAAEAAAARSPIDATPENLALGERMYGIYCTPCHGDGVNLGPLAAPGRVPAIPVLSGADGRLKNLSDGWVYSTIRNGSVSQIMPPYGYMMTEYEMWSVVLYMRTLEGAAFVPPAAPAPTENPQ